MFWWKNLMKAVAPVINIVNTVVQGIAKATNTEDGWFAKGTRQVTQAVNQAAKPSSAAHTGSNRQGRPKPTVAQQQSGGAQEETPKDNGRQKAERDEAIYRQLQDKLPKDIAEQEDTSSFGEGIAELGEVDLSPIRMVSTVMNSPVVRSVDNMNTTMLSIFNGMVQGHNGNIAKAVENFFADHYAEDMNPSDVRSIKRILGDLNRRREVELKQMMAGAKEMEGSLRDTAGGSTSSFSNSMWTPRRKGKPKIMLFGNPPSDEQDDPEATEEPENDYVDPCLKAEDKNACYISELSKYGVTISTEVIQVTEEQPQREFDTGQLAFLLETSYRVGTYLAEQGEEAGYDRGDYLEGPASADREVHQAAFQAILGEVTFTFDPSLEDEPGKTIDQTIHLRADAFNTDLVPAHELGHIFQNRAGETTGQPQTILGIENIPAGIPYLAVEYAKETDAVWDPLTGIYEGGEYEGNLLEARKQDLNLFYNENRERGRDPKEGFADAFAAATMRGEGILSGDSRGDLFGEKADDWVKSILDPDTFPISQQYSPDSFQGSQGSEEQRDNGIPGTPSIPFE